ncbi:MAG: hypothetical protein ACO29C_07060 [Fluviibacter sp.]
MNENELAGAPAPEQAPTAEPVAATDTPPEPTPTEASKTFTQEELDAIVGKRLAREQRKWEREQAQKAKSQPVPTEPLKADDFADAQTYADALAERKAQELLAKRDAEAERAAMLDAYHDREEEARNKYDDFEQVAYNPKLPVTETMAQTIQASDNGPDVIYYLGSNPKEAERIARLSPLLQAREIGKIEAKLGDNPPAKKTSTAPAPIAPVTARTSGAPAYDTTDPRSVKNMSTSEWIEAERLRQIKKYEANRRR